MWLDLVFAKNQQLHHLVPEFLEVLVHTSSGNELTHRNYIIYRIYQIPAFAGTTSLHQIW